MKRRKKQGKGSKRPSRRKGQDRTRSGGPKRTGPGRDGRAEATGRPAGTAKGILSVHRDGFGFLAQEGGGEDIYIGRRSMADAWHGDQVEVKVYERGKTGRKFGEVVKVLARDKLLVVGVLHRFEKNGILTPRNERLPDEFFLQLEDMGRAKDGELVQAKVWLEGGRLRRAKVTKALGAVGEIKAEWQAVLSEYGLSEEYPAAAVVQAKSYREPGPADLAGREDFTGVNAFTIDGADARDFDDAVSIERTAKGYRLGVYIAEVSHYVTVGSELDKPAYTRATSVYFPNAVLHMLPTELSTDLCSLKPDVVRLAMACVMDFDKQGKRLDYRLAKGYIRSCKRCTYQEVERVLNGEQVKGFGPITKALKIMAELAETLTAMRLARGAVDMEMPEAKVMLDENGVVTAIEKRDRLRSHRLIEEFMLAANEAVGEFTDRRRKPSIYRVHEPPPPDALQELDTQLQSYGLKLPRLEGTTGKDIQKVIDAAAPGSERETVSRYVLRAMQMAKYQATLLPHFGLAASHYTHFTSPIRRYPDLLVHRVIKEALETGVVLDDSVGAGLKPARTKAYTFVQLDRMAAHCSDRERNAQKAEWTMNDFFAAALMSDMIGEEFSGRVNGVVDDGFFVQLDQPFVEGFVREARKDPSAAKRGHRVKRQDLKSQPKSGRKPGDAVRIRVKGTDLVKRRVDFELI